MNRPRVQWTTIRRAARRAGRAVLLLVFAGVLLGAVGVAGVWGHFWSFRVGDPSAESCATCHTMQPYVESEQMNTALASAHAAEGVRCTDCHTYGAQEQLRDTLAFLRNDYSQPLQRARYEMDMCFECHEHGSYDQLAWRTTDLGVTDAQAKGHDANPHQPPHYTNLECHTCHRVHTEGTLLCWECHQYEFPSRFLGPRPEVTPQAGAPGAPGIPGIPGVPSIPGVSGSS